MPDLRLRISEAAPSQCRLARSADYIGLDTKDLAQAMPKRSQRNRARLAALDMTQEVIETNPTTSGAGRDDIEAEETGQNKGWQWLFVIEGIPSVLLGIVTWFYLTDRPEKAEWLDADQKAWLASKLQAENAAKQATGHRRRQHGSEVNSQEIDL
jgi:hypothetical protein